MTLEYIVKIIRIHSTGLLKYKRKSDVILLFKCANDKSIIWC